MVCDADSRHGAGCDLHHQSGGKGHILHRDKLQRAMHILHACQEIGARHTHFGQARAIGAATDHRLDRGDADLGQCRTGKIHGGHVIFEPVAHIAVLRRDLDVDLGPRLCGGDGGADLAHQIALGGQPIAFEIAQDEADDHLIGAALHVDSVDEPLAIRGGFGRHGRLRQGFDDAACQMDGIDQLARRLAGVDRDASDSDDREISGEGLIDDFACVTAIEGIGKIDAEIGGEFGIDTAPDLFVGGEGDKRSSSDFLISLAKSIAKASCPTIASPFCKTIASVMYVPYASGASERSTCIWIELKMLCIFSCSTLVSWNGFKLVAAKDNEAATTTTIAVANRKVYEFLFTSIIMP